MIILRKLIFFVYCGGIYNNRVQQFVNFGAPSFLSPRFWRGFFLLEELIKLAEENNREFRNKPP